MQSGQRFALQAVVLCLPGSTLPEQLLGYLA